MINSIELTNWKTHKNTKIEFSKGTNVIIGQMGAGKSTVMDAIAFSFFGTFPGLKHKKNSLSGIIKNRPLQEESASVKLDFTVGDDSYIVERNLQLNGASKATLTKNGSYLQSQPERVNEEIGRILKVDYDLFSRAVYSEQNGLDYFLRIRAKDRKEQIDGLLGLDKFTTASDNSNALAGRLKDMIADKESTLSQFNIETLRSQALEYRTEHAALLESGKRLNTALLETRSKSGMLEAQLKELKRLSQMKTELARQLSELRSRRAYIEQELSKIDPTSIIASLDAEAKLQESLSRLLESKKKEESLAEKESELSRSVGRLNADVDEAEKKVERRNRLAAEHDPDGIAGAESGIKSSQERIQFLEAESARFFSADAEGSRWLSELRKHLSKCPVCERDLSPELCERLISEREEAIARARSGAEEAKKGLAAARKESEKLKSKLEGLRVAAAMLSEYSNVDAELAKKRETANAEASRLRSTTAERKMSKLATEAAQSGVDSARRKKDEMLRREKYLKDLDDTGIQAAKKESELSSISVDDRALDVMQAEFVEASSVISRLSAEKSANDRYAAEKKAQIEDKEREIASIERLHSEIKSDTELAEEIAKFKTSIDETKMSMRSRLITSINSVLDDIWPDIYPYDDYPGIRLNATSEDYVLEVMVEKDGKKEWLEVESVASGGERSTACLALRVGFALVLVPNLRWIILDEPTHNIDQEGIGRFVKVFNESLPKIIDQIFVITHDELLKHSSSAKTYMLARNKAKGEPTAVTEI